MNEIADSYFVGRFENEIAAADNASCHQARVIHLELALRYSMLAKPVETQAARPTEATAVAPVVHLAAV
jgi:GTP cyclohydrolase III